MKNSRIVTGVLALALLAVVVTDAFGQDEGRRGRGPGGPGGPGGFGRGGGDPTLMLLGIEEVRKELEITAVQEEALKKLAEQARPERPEGVDFRSMSEEERRAFFEEMQAKQETRMSELKAQLEEVLLLSQAKRLQEISLQVRGVQALDDEQVASELNITAEQKKQLEEVRQNLMQEMREKMQAMFAGGGGGDRGSMQEQFAKIRQEMSDKILAVLTEEQRQQFEEMKGEKFELPEGAFGMGRGPGGPGGFGGRGRGGDDEGGRRERREP